MGTGGGSSQYAHGTVSISFLQPAPSDDVPGFYSDASNGYKYATMDGTSYSLTSNGCQTAYLNLPTGWELAPADGDGIRIGTGLAWGTHVVVFSNGESYRTYNFGGASNKNRYTATNYLATSTLNGAPAYKPNGCHLRRAEHTYFVRYTTLCDCEV